MIGLPGNLFTREDWINAVEYAKAHSTGKDVMISRLNGLKSNTKINILKSTALDKPAEEQTPEDFEAIDDPNCEMLRLGFTAAQIENLIGGLQ
jgi:orotidine-5'-phosphate decarboxylase